MNTGYNQYGEDIYNQANNSDIGIRLISNAISYVGVGQHSKDAGAKVAHNMAVYDNAILNAEGVTPLVFSAGILVNSAEQFWHGDKKKGFGMQLSGNDFINAGTPWKINATETYTNSRSEVKTQPVSMGTFMGINLGDIKKPSKNDMQKLSEQKIFEAYQADLKVYYNGLPHTKKVMVKDNVMLIARELEKYTIQNLEKGASANTTIINMKDTDMIDLYLIDIDKSTKSNKVIKMIKTSPTILSLVTHSLLGTSIRDIK